MKLDTLTNQIYVVAVNEARLQGHEYVMPEHFLYSALMFDLGKEIVQDSGGRVEAIVDDLRDFFESRVPRRVTENPTESFSFVQMFELAAAQAHSTGKHLVTLGELLAAIFFLKESFAQYILLKNGMDRLDTRRYAAREPDDPAIQAHDARGSTDKTAQFLQAYTVDLCEKAANGNLDPLVGRDEIIERTVQVLCRRLKNNPVHVGDPGVGKTAVAEGLAQRIVDNRVPEALRGAKVLLLDMGALIAGTKYRGDFEERLVKLLEIIERIPKPVVYIDEIHTVVGAGAVSGGGMDATGIIKPYLSRGEIRFIGSTTFDEYKKHFEKDRALARRFQRIDVPEPTEEECVQILQGLKPRYEKHHGVVYPDDTIRLICRLSVKYMNDRFLPDKAIDVMDESGVYTHLNAGESRHLSLPHAVSQKTVERTVAMMAKVPENSVTGDEKQLLSGLEEKLNSAVFGQEQAVSAVADAIKSARSGLNEPERPVASLLFVGPTGVGKTEVARQLAHILSVKLLRYDMSEYQEKHAVARLIGSPPGYVGYEEGGLLTEAIRRTPHCVLLLDEIEKAHGDILNVLLQVMDYGNLTDNTGKKARFENVIIIMTSNAGAREMTRQVIGFEGGTDGAAAGKAVERLFSPEFRNRLDAIVPFRHVDGEMARRIAKKALDRLSEKLLRRGVAFTATEAALGFIAEKGRSETYGAREIIRLVENDIKKKLVNEVLFGKLSEGGDAELDVEGGAFTVRV
ncbi:MAG: AAA family ATPase [Clostridiales bacterium]|jgi:ATP-dependent Clp protease ATP-binding subunit ClpA|nr:AAA family ATPase [Clostridiales bacterium]